MGSDKSYESVTSYTKMNLRIKTSIKSSGESSKRKLLSHTSSQEATIHGSSRAYSNQETKKLKTKSRNYPMEEQQANRKKESGKWLEKLSRNRVEENPAKRKLLSYTKMNLRIKTSIKSSGESSKQKLLSQRSSQEATIHGSSRAYSNQETKKLKTKSRNYPMEEQQANRKKESGKWLEKLSRNRVEENSAKRKLLSYTKMNLRIKTSIKSSGESSKQKLLSQRSSQEATIHGSSRAYSNQETKKLKTKSRNYPMEEQQANRKKESGKWLEKSSRNHVEENPAKRKRESGKLPERLSHNCVENQPAMRKRESGKLPERLSFCGICMEKKTKAEMFKSKNCSHSYCLVCVGKHVAAKIRENIIKVKCPDLACNGLLEPQDCRSVVPQQVLDRWEAALCESVLGSKIYCPFKDCSAPLVDDGRQAVTLAECPHCHRLFCARCKVPWHAGSGCKRQVETMDKKFIELAKREKWQKCPNCKFYVQRTHGCESIKCRCGYKFCYICGNGCIFGHVCPTG